MAAGKLNLPIEAGATFSRVFTWKVGSPLAPVNLTGYTAHAQIRDSQGALKLDLPGLALGGSAGTITLTITAAQTTTLALALGPGTGQWDLKVTAGDGTVTRLLSGLVPVSQEVTV